MLRFPDEPKATAAKRPREPVLAEIGADMRRRAEWGELEALLGCYGFAGFSRIPEGNPEEASPT
jgi:hypothetical protein